ncbi:PaaI family thioesterase [Mitsuaria sp. CC2]|uniref:PaaI family thioesterase n=1 Tax=Mitsuaria sp. CC2 TaxID=3029186 RepID=UPI003B8CD43D
MTQPPDAPSPDAMSVDELRAQIPKIFAPWIVALGLDPVHAEAGLLRLTLPVTPALVHVGGVMCGQASMAAADTAMVLLMLRELGEFRPMTTVQLQSTFVRPVSGTSCTIEARLLRRGRNLAFGRIDLFDEQGRLAVQATTTYALL